MGYTDRLDKAMRDEPEAVSKEVSEGLTADAHARRHAEIVAKWKLERARLLDVLERLREEPLGRLLRNEIRELEQLLKRVDRRL